MRINVNSGRPLEHLAHYSRALRAGHWVLQSGTTAIDRAGAVIGVGDVAKQVDAIVAIAEESMGCAGGSLDDVVRSRIYLTDITLADQAGRALARHFKDVRPAATLIQINALARPAQLVEIEFDAIDGARDRAVRFGSGRPSEEIYAYSRAVRVDDHVFIAGTTALEADGKVAYPGDMHQQTRAVFDTIASVAEAAGASLADLVYTKTFVTAMARSHEQRVAKLDALGDVRPAGTLLGVPGLLMNEMLIEVEAEAIIGASGNRKDVYTGKRNEHALGFARAVESGPYVYVSGCTARDDAGGVFAPGDWAAQYDRCHETISSVLGQLDMPLDDIVRRRTFTKHDAHMNRPYGEGPGWFENSRPTSLGCRVRSFVEPAMLVEVDAFAIRGAHQDIEWRQLG